MVTSTPLSQTPAPCSSLDLASLNQPLLSGRLLEKDLHRARWFSHFQSVPVR